jgi:hypothetical protein
MPTPNIIAPKTAYNKKYRIPLCGVATKVAIESDPVTKNQDSNTISRSLFGLNLKGW